MVGSEKRAAAEAIMDRLVELRAHNPHSLRAALGASRFSNRSRRRMARARLARTPTSSPSCWRLVAPTRPPSHCRPAGSSAPISTRRIPLGTGLVGTDPSSVSAIPHSKFCWLTTASRDSSSSRDVLSSPSSPATNLLEYRWTTIGSPAPRCVWRYGSCWHRAGYQGRLPLGFQRPEYRNHIRAEPGTNPCLVTLTSGIRTL
jgi:hypothetical protein